MLKISGSPVGVRAYLCVPGGIDVPEIMGSRSSFGPISEGQSFACRPSNIAPVAVGYTPLPLPVILRVLPGPQNDWFLNPAEFTDGDYTVQPASNRMGIRLVGKSLTRRIGELPSEPVAPGAVQVTNDGQPVILGVEGQTIGGYPKVAHIIRADLDRLGQLRPGDLVRFHFVNTNEAKAAVAERAKRLSEWKVRIEARKK